ncbi:MAG TPA: Gfo/Idh/MocA family oxidoreductase [Candidatus Hydrogenedentes bacterium]|nr:Gfo/Idh/MocA family oxidoreductase [Candidatus Hydrogenedentota bacterium]HPG67991.1 Gfo/Idh/MocA family oxidoreductase [Candidatus Hydrogenedentota bacterium]
MGQKTLGVLVHGAGWVAGEHIKAFAANPHTEVVAISSRKLSSCERKAAEAGLDKVALYTNYEKALAHEGVDIVSVCTPQHLHAENTIAAAEAGKNIVIEKPIANSPAEMRAMLEAVQRAGVKTIVSFVLRWNPLFETIKAMVEDDAVGNVYCVETDYQHDIASWWSGFEEARTKEKGVSAMLTGGCHALDAARWFAAQGRYKAATPVEIFAYAGGWRKGRDIEYNYFSNSFQKAPPLEYDDLEIVLIRFDNGALGKVSVNYGCVMPYAFPVEIFGDRGTIKDNRVWSQKFPGQKAWVEIPTILPVSADVSHHPFQGQMDHFVDCIRNGRESHCNLEDAVKTHEIVFAAQESYATKRPVSLPLPRP